VSKLTVYSILKHFYTKLVEAQLAGVTSKARMLFCSRKELALALCHALKANTLKRNFGGLF